nr:hypothetical protein [Tanacetum cinerariifolium]
MVYRTPHVVMGDRLGNVRWWDVISGQSSSFNTHREGIRRIRFSPVVSGDRSLGRIAVLFNDNTFSVFDLTQYPGTLVLELDWLPVRTDKNDPLVLCIAGADSSFRLIQVNIDTKVGYGGTPQCVKERFRPMPLCSPVLLPSAHALAFRLILQYGVKPSWINTSNAIPDKPNSQLSRNLSGVKELRSYLIDASPVGDSVVPELLLKALETYRKEGCLLDDERVRQYATVINKGCAARFSFAAAVFGETLEACFWLQLPLALKHLLNMLANKPLRKPPVKLPSILAEDKPLLTRTLSKGRSVAGSTILVNDGQFKMMAFEQEELWENASERITWHERLEGEQAIQNIVHELVTVGNLDAAVNLLLSTPPESSFFYPNALRAVALSSAVSRSLNELAVKVVAANMVRTDRSLSGTHLLCAVGRYQEACSQLQDAGCWTDAATLAATHLKGTDYARVMHRWAGHVLNAEHNIWRALIMYVAAGSLQDALSVLREAQQSDTAAMFIIACREVHAEFIDNLDPNDESSATIKEKLQNLRGLNPQSEDVIAVGELYTQIRDYDMLDGLKVPTNLNTYDGMSDPDDHLIIFMGTMDVHMLPEPAWCRFFHITLCGAARFWEFGHFAKECRKPKRVKDSAYHKEKMLLCKQAEQGVPLQAEQYDWLANTDEEVDEQELEAHYSYMAKIQEVPTADLGTDSERVEQVQNEARYNVFANHLQHSEQSKSVNNTCLVETDDSNVIPDSPDMCEDDIQNEQNDVDNDDERVVLANLIANLKLDVDEKKKIQKQLKKANTTLAQELKECKTIIAETSKSLRESISVRDSCLVALQTKQAEFEKFKAFNDRTVPTYNGRPTFANSRYLKQAQSKISCLYAFPYDHSIHANILIPNGEETLALERESRSKLNKDLVRPYDYTKLNSLYEIFKPPTQEYEIYKNIGFLPVSKSISKSRQAYNVMTNNINHFKQIVDDASIKDSKDQFRTPIAQDIEILIQTCLMPLAIKTQNDSFKLVHELKQEMHADLKYVESLEKEIDELESDKAEFSDMYDEILQECVSKDVMCSYLMSLSDLDVLDELQCLYLHKVKEYDCLTQKLSKQTESVSKKVHTELSQHFAKVEKHSISFELALQKYLKAQLQDKNIAISELKKLIEKGKAISVDTKFDRPSVVRQPNAQRIPKLLVLGKPTPFSNSLDRIYFQKTKSVPKANVLEGLSKPVTAQTLPQAAKKAASNTNVLKLEIVNHKPTVSRPQLKSNQSRDKVLSNNSQVKAKKTQVEVHPRIPSVSNKIKSVTACKDSLNSITLNANAVCATCNKCLVDSNHFACVTKMLNDVHARTKKPNVVPISTRKPKSQENKSMATPNKKKGNDLLFGNHGSNLYTISLQESTSSTPLCLMAKATPTQAWLWHRRLSHLNFDYINLLSKKDIVIGLPKLKYVNDQLCSSCELSKAKRSSFKSKAVSSSKGRLNLIHMNLCGLMRVASINRKKYILVIVDDYSRYTWTLFLRSKDEAPEVLKDFLTMIQRNLCRC